MRLLIISIILLSAYGLKVLSQADNVHIYHSVYPFLERMLSRGIYTLDNLNDLPMKRIDIINALNELMSKSDELSEGEKKLLNKYLKEFFIINEHTHSLIKSSSDSNQIFFSGLISESEKFIYRYQDSINNVAITPLASLDFMIAHQEESKDALIGNLGFRLFGTIEQNVGYKLQVTNGTLFRGDRVVANRIKKYSQNIKFNVFDDDIDFTESHINYHKGWFNFNIGRESRLIGAGFNQRLVASDNSPAFDAIQAGAKFEKFNYKFMHASILAQADYNGAGSYITIPAKYYVTHRFAFTPTWGEFAFWEALVYSNRHPDIAYLNPLSFLKSLEHALRDRDNALMGFDLTFRLLNGLLLKGSFLLDDIRFEKIGTKYWGNKTAYNLGAILAYIPDIDITLEYARVQPYTFSHFNQNNSVVNDGSVISSYLLPNSESYSLKTRFWWGSRYPLVLGVKYIRHGDNEYDETGELIRNVGGNHMEGFVFESDNQEVVFLDGNLNEILSFEVSAGFEIFRGYNFLLYYNYSNQKYYGDHFIRILLRFDEF